MRPSSTFEEEMSRFEAEIGNKTTAQLAANTSNPYQQAMQPASLSQSAPSQTYLGTTIPGTGFPTRPPMIPPALFNTNKSNPYTNRPNNSSQTGSFPPPPPAVLLNNAPSKPLYSGGSGFHRGSSGLGNFISNKSHISMSSAPTIYSAPATNKTTNEDDDDILAILQKTEKEVKKDAKDTKRPSGSTGFKPSSVSASESNKKAKLMADKVRANSTTTVQTVQIPQSTKDRMLGLKKDKNER